MTHRFGGAMGGACYPGVSVVVGVLLVNPEMTNKNHVNTHVFMISTKTRVAVILLLNKNLFTTHKIQ